MNYRHHSNHNKKVKSQFYSLSLQGLATHLVFSPRSTMDDVKDNTLMIHADGDNHSDHPKSLDGSVYCCHIRQVVKQHLIDMALSTQLLNSTPFHQKVGKHLSVNGDLLLFDDAKSKRSKKGLAVMLTCE